jgi:hypothetical protein
LQDIKNSVVTIKTGDRDITERIQDGPLCLIALQILPVFGIGGKIQSQKALPDPFTNLCPDFPESLPPVSQVRQAPLEERHTWLVFHGSPYPLQ